MTGKSADLIHFKYASGLFQHEDHDYAYRQYRIGNGWNGVTQTCSPPPAPPPNPVLHNVRFSAFCPATSISSSEITQMKTNVANLLTGFTSSDIDIVISSVPFPPSPPPLPPSPPPPSNTGWQMYDYAANGCNLDTHTDLNGNTYTTVSFERFNDPTDCQYNIRTHSCTFICQSIGSTCIDSEILSKLSEIYVSDQLILEAYAEAGYTCPRLDPNSNTLIWTGPYSNRMGLYSLNGRCEKTQYSQNLVTDTCDRTTDYNQRLCWCS